MADKSPQSLREMRGLDDAIASLRNSMKSDRTKEFFTQAEFENYHYLSYKELIAIFGKQVNYDYVPSANRRLIRTHFLAYNQAFDNLWKYKYPILLARLGYLGCTNMLIQTRVKLHQCYCICFGSRE